MAVKKRTTAVGLFHERSQAEAAINDLRQRGFRNDHLGILTRAEQGQPIHSATDLGTKIEEGALGGALAGASIGTLAGLAVIAGLMPPLGPAIAGGILGSVLSSVGLGVAAGGLIGGLIGLGVPEDEARYFEQEVQAGRTIVTVRADNRYEEAWKCLRDHGAYDMKTPRQATIAHTVAPNWAGVEKVSGAAETPNVRH